MELEKIEYALLKEIAGQAISVAYQNPKAAELSQALADYDAFLRICEKAKSYISPEGN